jgi:tRNA threonylcarbamoyladenosine biosynthesis protein TsaB
MSETMLLMGVDTCGPSGSIALARLSEGKLESLGQTELLGRSYSATLVAAVGDLLNRTGTNLAQLRAMVAVNGPGSFTGVRVGLSAVKGLAEPFQIPVIAVSRLEVLAHKADVASSALDAHRHEAFLRLAVHGAETRELLAGRAELAAIGSWPDRVAVCDDSAVLLLGEAWPVARLIRVAAPTASDALELAVPRILAEDFVDLALLDGHYLRRSDAEIFGEAATVTAQQA